MHSSVEMAATTYETESDCCCAVLNSLHEKYKGQIEMKFLASYQYMRIAIPSKNSLGQRISNVLLNV